MKYWNLWFLLFWYKYPLGQSFIILLRFYLFKNIWNMSSFIANKVKKQIRVQVQSNSLLYIHLCVTLFPTYTTYTTITIIITVCSIFFSHNYSLFCSQRRSSNHDCSVHIQINFTQGLLYSYLLVVCFILPFYSPTQTV